MRYFKNQRIKKETVFTFSLFAMFFLLWEITVAAGWINSPFLPSPSAIIKNGASMLAQGQLQGHVFATINRILFGFLTGALAGLLVGYAAGRSKSLRFIIDPFITIIYPIPKIAILPLIMLLVGIGEHTLILVIALSAFFPVLINCIAGVLNINPAYFDLAKIYGANSLQIFTHVTVPGSLSMASAGIRLASGMSLVMTVVVELAISDKGLGALLWVSWSVLKVESIYLAVFIIAVLSLLINLVINTITGFLTPWQTQDKDP